MLKEFVEYVTKHLVDDPSRVVVEIKSEEDKKIVFALRVGQEDIGKVIGKEGKTAQAIRTLLTAIAAKAGKRAILEILD